MWDRTSVLGGLWCTIIDLGGRWRGSDLEAVDGESYVQLIYWTAGRRRSGCSSAVVQITRMTTQ